MEKTISVDDAVSRYGSTRGLSVLGGFLFLPGFLLIGIITLLKASTPQELVFGVGVVAIASPLLLWLVWYAFGPSFLRLRQQERMLEALDTEVRNTWFMITSQEWITTPIVNLQDMVTHERYWYATVQLNGSEVAVMVEEKWWKVAGFTEASAPTHIKFPDARYDDSRGELYLNISYTSFALKLS